MQTLLATIIIPIVAIALPAFLGLWYFIQERKRERANVTTALAAEMGRIHTLLADRLTWLKEPGSLDLPLMPFETSLYDAHVGKIGACDPSFATVVVSFYGIVHFLNALQAKREAYENVHELERFLNTYAKTVHRALLRYGELPK